MEFDRNGQFIAEKYNAKIFCSGRVVQPCFTTTMLEKYYENCNL
jgi:hypothetical protein